MSKQMDKRIRDVAPKYPKRVWCRFVEVWGSYDHAYSMPSTEAPDAEYEDNVPVGEIAPPVEYIRADLVMQIKGADEDKDEEDYFDPREQRYRDNY